MLDSGQFALKTPAGFVHPVAESEHPVSDDWPELPDTDRFKFSAAEFFDTLERIRTEQALQVDHIDLWEDGERAFREFADGDTINAVYDQVA